MSNTSTHKIVLVVCLILGVHNLLAQFQDERETKTYFYKDNPTEVLPIDTGLDNIEEYNFLQKDGWEYIGVGNTGLAHRYLALDWDYSKGFKNGMRHFDRYKFDIDRIKYYNVERPLSDFSYSIGANNENIVKAQHAQNIKNVFELGIDFHRIRSIGIYNNQQVRNAGFSLYGIYTTKNEKFKSAVDVVYSQIKGEENGGLVDNILADDFEAFNNPEVYETNLSDALTRHQNFGIQFTNSYRFGFYQIDSITDSLAVRKFYPTIEIAHSLGTRKNMFRFDQPSPVDTAFYGDFFQPDDSMYFRLAYHEIPHSVSFRYLGTLKDGDSVKYQNFVAEAGIQHDNIELWQNRNELTTNNLHVFGSFGSNPLGDYKFNYRLKTYYYLAGYNQNDFHLSGQMSNDFDKFGKVSAGLVFENVAPSWIENSYFSTSKRWDNNFNKKQNLKVEGAYHLPKQRFRIHFQYNILNNFIFFNESSVPEQVDQVLNYWRLSVWKNLRWKILNFDNFIGVQGISDPDVLRIPTLFLKSSFYIEGKIFKGNMLARLGVDMRFLSNFTSDAWNPLIGQFYIQNDFETNFIPVFDVFASFKVQTVRIFFKANYASQGLFQDNFYAIAFHPDRGRTITGGFTWRFFE